MPGWTLAHISDGMPGPPLSTRINRGLARVPDWPIYVGGAVPPVWLYAQGVAGRLGVNPVEVIEHRLGLWALWLLLAGLAITPLRRLFNLNLIRFRRAIGVLAFAYVVVHLLTWAILDVQSVARVWADIVKRPYVTIGMSAFVLLVPLALTSWSGAIRRMGGRAWRRLHMLVYPAVVLGAVHFVMLRKGWQVEPLLYLLAVLVLLTLRLRRRRP